MDATINNLKDLRSKLIKMRDLELDKFVFGVLTDNEMHEMKGLVLGISKILALVQTLMEEHLKNSDLPYNLRILEDEAKKYNIGITDSGLEYKGKYNDITINHIS